MRPVASFMHAPSRLSWQHRAFLAVLSGALLVAGVPAWATSAATTTTLTMVSGGSTVASGGSVVSDKTVALTATVLAGATPVTRGTVNFCDASAAYCTDIHLLGTAQLTPAGTAVLHVRPTSGSHSYKAVFVGTTTEAGSSSGTSTLTVTGPYPSITTISKTGSAGNYTLTALVSGEGSAAPSGTVSFVDTSNGNMVLGSATLGAGTAGTTSAGAENPLWDSQTPDIFTKVGDFNGDGIPDLVIANVIIPSTGDFYPILVQLGNGDGTFGTPSLITLPSGVDQASAVAVGDFNGDGKLDIAVASVSKNLTVLLGNGDGTFTATPNGSVVEPNSLGQMITGDFNRDGILDLATASEILLGNGDGTFTAAITSPSLGSLALVAADFNGDGILDLATAGGSIFLGVGDGEFSASTGTGVSGGYDIATGDFNGDGIPDLAVSGNSTVTILLGDGSGGFTSHQVNLPVVGDANFPGDDTLAGIGIVAGDFNGDGKMDLAVHALGTSDSEDRIVLDDLVTLTGDGTGNFTSDVSYSSPLDLSTPQMDNHSSAIAASDFNSDGITDLIGAFGSTDDNVHERLAILSSIPIISAPASVSGITLSPGSGTHQVVASYGGDSNFNASTSSALSLASAVDTSTSVALTFSANPTTHGASVSLIATVTGTGITPTGTVTFSDSYGQIGQATLDGSGVATYTTSAFPVGTYSITAAYGGDTNHSAASSMAESLQVNAGAPATTPTVTVTPGSSSITSAQDLSVVVAVSGGTGKPTPTGTVEISSGSYSSAVTALSGGSATIDIPAWTLAAGAYTFTASYIPDSGSTATYTTATGTSGVVAVSNAAPTISSISPANATAGGAAFTLTVTGNGFTSGSTVYWGINALTTHYVSTTELTAQVPASDIATSWSYAVTVQTPAPGGGTSSPQDFEVNSAGAGTPSFTTLTATVVHGSPASFPVTLPSSVLSATVTCLNLPSGATCSYSSSTHTVTITTLSATPSGTYQITVVFTETLSGTSTALVLLPFLLLPLWAARRRMTAGQIWLVAVLGIGLMAAGAVIGCGSSGSSSTSPTTHTGTSSGVVTLTVT